jgi:hypothetical protein
MSSFPLSCRSLSRAVHRLAVDRTAPLMGPGQKIGHHWREVGGAEAAHVQAGGTHQFDPNHAVSDADTSELQLNIYMERKPRLTTEGHFPQNIDMS